MLSFSGKLSHLLSFTEALEDFLGFISKLLKCLFRLLLSLLLSLSCIIYLQKDVFFDMYQTFSLKINKNFSAKFNEFLRFKFIFRQCGFRTAVMFCHYLWSCTPGLLCCCVYWVLIQHKGLRKVTYLWKDYNTLTRGRLKAAVWRAEYIFNFYH